MSAINPNIPNASTNPINLISAIQTVNAELLTGLTWLTKAFRLAFKHTLSEQNGEAVIPRVYDESGDYYNCVPNDDLQAFSFWYLEDDSKNPEFVAEDGSSFGHQTNINFVIWFDTTSILTGVFDEKIELIEEQITRLLENSVVDIEYTQIFRDYPQTYSAFNINNTKQQYLNYPYFGFRFLCNLKYSRYCSTI